ncbi:CRISPR-associated protein Csb1 [Singulisphaera sp. GP187]|uniref:type I-G CRISPR-associated RAMP protein Csb1/Cas7g n=1 Tax=Singulisphaera sp. GP187 TaxID=1882752 RepID=UPI00092ABE5D|nr:type I-U CRISPR-associated RAMP protein Csb1/Cas7u [Singulisphaera sp. GP187]SIO61246.1 CRISPR-associated protein Csb1 [Singulisphaera sp. GP187]
MSFDDVLNNAPRILIEAHLKPVAGTRIQPTGFPDLGAAQYDAPDDKGGLVKMLLVESAQSMANRLEAVCWDEATDDIAPELTGLPFVAVKLSGLGNGTDMTSSLLEFHRLNSPYIMNGTRDDGSVFADVIRKALGLGSVPGKKTSKKGADAAPTEETTGEKERVEVAGVVNLRKLASVCFQYDPNSLVHGVFLEKIAGRLRHPRALSAFIEASGVERADSGGVKFDRVLPSPKVGGVDSAGGYGNVPFHRSEYTARSITAFFSLDLAQIRGYGLPAEATKLLKVLALWKVRRFLDSNMRLRTACELEVDEKAGGIEVVRPEDFALPSTKELAKELTDLIKKCKPHFANPTKTVLTWNKPVSSKE